MFRQIGFATLAVLLVSPMTLAQSAPPPSGVTGTWTGVVVFKSDGQSHEDPFRVVLKQEGATLIGTAGPDADRQYSITSGKATTTRDATAVTFNVTVDGVYMALELKLDLQTSGGVLKGSAAIEGEDGQRRTATVELKPAKARPQFAFAPVARMKSWRSRSTTAA